MPLTGTYERSADEKNRLAIPKRLRDSLDDPAATFLYITPGTDRSLCLYSEQSLDKLATKLAESPPTRGDVRAFSRLFYAQTERVDLDAQGRIVIPERLAQQAGIARDVVLIGVQDHIELWDRKRWEVYVEENSGRFDRVAEQAFQDRNPGMETT